jgi:hypothetical protein
MVNVIYNKMSYDFILKLSIEMEKIKDKILYNEEFDESDDNEENQNFPRRNYSNFLRLKTEFNFKE